MSNPHAHPVQFFRFDQAVSTALNDPGAQFVELRFVEPFSHRGVYVINVDADEPGNVSLFYEGGVLFDVMGEEDFYDVEDAPAESKALFYARVDELGSGTAQVMGMTSEFVLQKILPGLSKEAKYRDNAHFMEAAGAAFPSYWHAKDDGDV